MNPGGGAEADEPEAEPEAGAYGTPYLEKYRPSREGILVYRSLGSCTVIFIKIGYSLCTNDIQGYATLDYPGVRHGA
jgi:hypothetical protein